MQTAASRKSILHFQHVEFVLYIFLEVTKTSQPQTKTEKRNFYKVWAEATSVPAKGHQQSLCNKKMNDCCSHFPLKMWRKSLCECMVDSCKLFYARQLNEAWITTSLVWMSSHWHHLYQARCLNHTQPKLCWGEKKKITHQQAIFVFSDSKTQQYLAMEGLKIWKT